MPNIMTAGKKLEKDDKEGSVLNLRKKIKKMVETFSARWRVAALEGVILGSWALKRNHQNRTMLMGRQETALRVCTLSCNPALKFK